MWELDHEEGWVLNPSWWFWIVLEETLQSPLACKEIKPVDPKGNQSWIFIERTDGEAEAPRLWPPDAKSWWLSAKDPDAGKDWEQEEKEATKDEMVREHHWRNAHEFSTLREIGVLQSVGSQRVRHDLATEQQQHSAVVGFIALTGKSKLDEGLRREGWWICLLSVFTLKS